MKYMPDIIASPMKSSLNYSKTRGIASSLDAVLLEKIIAIAFTGGYARPVSATLSPSGVSTTMAAAAVASAAPAMRLVSAPAS